MISFPMQEFRYNSDLSGGSLLVRESRVIAELLLVYSGFLCKKNSKLRVKCKKSVLSVKKVGLRGGQA
jgi:hypothetical protein